MYVLHENPAWFGPFADEFAAVGLAYAEWPLDEGALDLDSAPPPGVFWSRMSASAHTRGHPRAAEHARALLAWLAAHGRRVVNGSGALDLELSKVAQLTALRAAGFDVPRTVAVAGDDPDRLLRAASGLPRPFLSKPNRGGKGLGVRLFGNLDDYAAHLASADHLPPVDGITLLQEYVAPASPTITRVEVVGGEVLYAVAADTARGGFELCPADACAVPGPGEAEAESLFSLRDGWAEPIGDRYLDFAGRHGVEVAGFEYLETADGRQVTYDINTTTNYNPQVEALAPRSGRRAVAHLLGRLLAEEETR